MIYHDKLSRNYDYLLEASLLDRSFSMSLSALHFSFSVFTESFLFNILKSTTLEAKEKIFKNVYFYCNIEWLRKKHSEINWNSIRLNPHVWTHKKKFSWICFYELHFLRVVLVHDTRSNDSRSNDAQFMHKLYINYTFLWMS